MSFATDAMPLYRGMDAATLDREYNARASVPSYAVEAAAYVRESARVQQELPGFETVVYDERSGEKLDLYDVAPGRPVFLWVHGGYWRGGSRHDNAFAAGGLTQHGVSVAVMDYTLAPAVGIAEIVRQVRAAVVWLARHGAERGLDVSRIHVGGSSAGGHLTGMLVAEGWTREAGLPDGIIGAALALSGLHDLEPLQHMHVNEWMRFSPEDIAQCSPERWIPRGSRTQLIASAGGLETSEFQRQTVDFAQRWKDAGNAVALIDMPRHNHFDIARSLCEPDGALVGAVLRAIKASRGA
ncbi:alpha/beta hydrolase [Cupriavidus basilensis]|uniref:Alpha/beta hydrolase n=1 Tax=Cupriavidus basilensis TaxID=68895 RepID=A0ABT6AX16_9BURK|nr:alpha/beta hydrolase [Cupriavidus basilensis]MDF3836908.1 alpha/beta hydrolase [Cupriavidus basilensis]